MSRLVFAALAVAIAAPPAIAGPRYADRSADQPFEHSYTGDWEHYVGGGVAVFDCNDDGFPEIYAAGGRSPSLLLINKTQNSGGALRFEPAEHQPPAQTGVIGAYPLEIDGDGISDLVVLRVGENILMRGLGNCAFERANETWRFDGLDRWTTAFSAAWEKGAEFPTLAFGNYVDRDNPDGPFFACDDNHLNEPMGRRYGAAKTLAPGFCALSMLFSDWGRKGQPDLRISNDRHYFVRGGFEQLWKVFPDPVAYTEAEGWLPPSIWGMGIASRDLNGDGMPEVFLTSIGDQKLRSLTADGHHPTYADATYDRGITAHVPYVGGEGRPSTGWHAAFGDVDNDGRDDLFITKGNVNQMPDAAMRDPNNLLLQTKQGWFVEYGDKAGIATTDRSRGGALVDLNVDGLLDIVVNNRRAGLELHQNVSEDAGAWVAIRPRQPAPNTDAVGAWIELNDGVKTWHREVTVGGGHAGGTLGYQHFGTGTSTGLRVRVIWPDGVQSRWYKVPTGQHILIEPGASPVVVAVGETSGN